jgi:erythronate-4-phosphate dehydrogenase
MKIIVDENVAYAKEAFGNFGEVFLVEGRNINSETIKDSDILIIRSVTNVNEKLLANSKIKFIGTATIGTDHVDVATLNSKNIYFANAKGCNSNAVAEYVITSLLAISNKHKIDLTDKSIGIIGYGNVGKKVEILATAIGLKTFVNDPPLQNDGFAYNFVSLEEALKCDIVTFHVPLNKTGIYKTTHLLNEQNISLIKKDTIIINTSRGQVVDNNALLAKINKDNNLTVLDVWENEPKCLPELVSKVEIGTAHVAGYSYEGKVIGTKMIYDRLCNYLNVPATWQPPIYQNLLKTYKYQSNIDIHANLHLITKDIYDIYCDSTYFKALMNSNNPEKEFDLIRKNYKLRFEFPNYLISDINENNIKDKINKLRFLTK